MKMLRTCGAKTWHEDRFRSTGDRHSNPGLAPRAHEKCCAEYAAPGSNNLRHKQLRLFARICLLRIPTVLSVIRSNKSPKVSGTVAKKDTGDLLRGLDRRSCERLTDGNRGRYHEGLGSQIGRRKESAVIVTIDGPAGAGKSTAARQLAERLGFDFLDTGAMYRAVALAGLRAGVDWTNETHVAELLQSVRLQMPTGRVLLNDEDVSAAIRTPEITKLSRPVADSAVVRRHLSELQRQIAVGRNLVTEGRDQGTIVFSDAACKFYLLAESTARAERRWRELQARGETISLEEVRRAQAERDARDEARAIAPMVPAADAIRIDSTQLDRDGVVATMERHVRERLARAL
jgi:cytidylate kinase